MPRSSSRIFRSSGFTLIELAIIIILIGLLTAAIFGGQAIAEGAKRASIVSDFQKYKAAYDDFTEKYLVVPGDNTLNWSAFDGGISLCNPNSCNNNGLIDGDRSDASYNEPFLAWRQLSFAGFIDGNYSGAVTSTSTNPELSTDVPAGRYNNTGYNIYNFVLPYEAYGNVNAVSLGAQVSSLFLDGSFISPVDAALVDEKMDDGNPLTGSLWGYPGRLATGAMPAVASDDTQACLNYSADGNYANDSYNTASVENGCFLIYLMSTPFAN